MTFGHINTLQFQGRSFSKSDVALATAKSGQCSDVAVPGFLIGYLRIS